MTGQNKFVNKSIFRQAAGDDISKIRASVGATRREIQLTPEEMKIYGKRCPPGYTKTKILGRGGMAVVYLASKDGRPYAIKQFPRGQFGFKSGLSETAVNSVLAEARSPSICGFHEAIEDKNDLWLIFEAVEGRPVFSALNELKGSFVMGERLYDVI